MTNTSAGPPPALLCVVGFPANTGFAWDFLEGLYARMASALAARGIVTYVAYPSIESPPVSLRGSPAVSVELDASLNDRNSQRLTAEFVRRHNVKSVFFIDRPSYNRRFTALRQAGVKRVVVYDHASGVRTRSTGMRRLAKSLSRRIESHIADEILVVSDYIGRRQVEVGLVPPERVFTVHNGLEVPLKNPDAGRDLRRRLGLAEDRIVIGATARAAVEKGIEFALKAFDLACRHWEEPLPAFVFFGDGPDLERLRGLRRELQHSEHVLLPGYQAGASDILEGADLCVVPSIWQDALPLSVLGSMARGNVVIGTRVGGVPEMIEDGLSGVLVDSGDAVALAEAMVATLADPETMQTIGAAARERVASHFRPEDQIARMVAAVEPAFAEAQIR